MIKAHASDQRRSAARPCACTDPDTIVLRCRSRVAGATSPAETSGNGTVAPTVLRRLPWGCGGGTPHPFGIHRGWQPVLFVLQSCSIVAASADDASMSTGLPGHGTGAEGH